MRGKLQITWDLNSPYINLSLNFEIWTKKTIICVQKWKMSRNVLKFILHRFPRSNLSFYYHICIVIKVYLVSLAINAIHKIGI